MPALCVFCSSSNSIDERYRACVDDVADFCQARGYDLVYGGSAGGLMGMVADAALKRDVSVSGVIPENLHKREVAHKGLDTLVVTDDMHQRQKTMADMADMFVVLPGGLGTLAELFEVLTWRQLGLHEKPIFLYDADGFWQPLTDMLDHMAKAGVLYGSYRDSLHIVGSMADVDRFL